MSDCDEKPEPRSYPRLKTLPVSNISEEGATFNADLYSLGTEEITDYGFVWGAHSSLSINSDDKVLLGIPQGEGIFSAEIKTTLAEGMEYTVRSFAISEGHTIYGPEVTFVSLGSLAPVIKGFEPDSAAWGDTLTIYGENFSWERLQNKVKLNETLCDITSSTDSTIIATIPPTLNTIKSSLSVELAGNSVEFMQKQFKLIPPTLLDFYPKQARWGDTLFIRGRDMNTISLLGNYIKLGNINCQIVRVFEDTLISVNIPNEITTINNTLDIKLNGFILSSQTSFTLVPPEIKSFCPLAGLRNSIVTIYGSFNPASKTSSIEIDNIPATVILYNRDSIQVRIPIAISHNNPSIAYKSAPFVITSANSFNVVHPLINQFSPQSGQFGDEITILGEYLSSTAGNTQVKFGSGVVATIKSLSEKEVTVNVPYAIDSIPKRIEVTVGYDLVNASQYFTLAPPVITSVQSEQSFPGGEISVDGLGFCPDPSLFKLYIDDYLLTITSATNSKIKANIPEAMPRNPLKLVLTMGGYKRQFPLNFEFKSQWLKIPVPSNIQYYASSERNAGIAFSVNSKGYFIMPATGQVASFDPGTNLFTDLGIQKIFEVTSQ